MADLSQHLYGAGPSLTGEDYLQTLPPQMQPLIKKYASGELPVPVMRGTNSVIPQVLEAITQYDPTFDATNFNARNKTAQDFSAGGVTGKKFGNINTALSHAGNLEQNFTSLNNTRFPLVNAIVNPLENALGNQRMQEHLGATKRNIEDLSGELAAAFRSTGMSEADIARQISALSSNESPAGMKGGMQATVKDLEGKFQPQIDAYNRTMGTHKTIADFITPEARTVYDRISAGKFGQVAKQPMSQSNAQPNSDDALISKYLK